MLIRHFALLALFTGTLNLPATAKTPVEPQELLFVGPLDTMVVVVDSNVDASALSPTKSHYGKRGQAPSEAALIARKFFPAFGDAVSMAARKVEVIDSTRASSNEDPDSSRYSLKVQRLQFLESSTSVPRRYMAPTPPAFDPATGMMNPGNRKGYSEGPGRVTTLTARAQWVIWDNATRVITARGTAVGESSYRGNAGKSQWDETARELAKSVLKQTAFTPF